MGCHARDTHKQKVRERQTPETQGKGEMEKHKEMGKQQEPWPRTWQYLQVTCQACLDGPDKKNPDERGVQCVGTGHPSLQLLYPVLQTPSTMVHVQQSPDSVGRVIIHQRVEGYWVEGTEGKF